MPHTRRKVDVAYWSLSLALFLLLPTEAKRFRGISILMERGWEWAGVVIISTIVRVCQIS